MSSNFAKRRLNEFKVKCGKYGNNALHLAYHAALPVALNPELLHFLRINFFLDPPNQLPFTVEFELLISLCREIDTELYEIEPEIRDELLRELIKEYSWERIREIASLLWTYVKYHSPWVERVELERAQQLTALNFLDSRKAKQWLDIAETSANQGIGGGREWFIAMRQEIEDIYELSRKEKTVIKQIQLQDLRQHISQSHLKSNILFKLIREMGFNPSEDLVGANLVGANLSGCDIRGVNLSGANLEGANLREANLSCVNLSNANLRFANLNHANLEEANLINTLLVNAIFENANLKNANLTAANLDEAFLLNSDMKSANLTNASLKDSNLSNADLKFANLTEVNFDNSIVVDAQFGDNIGFSEAVKHDLISRGIIFYEQTPVYPINNQSKDISYWVQLLQSPDVDSYTRKQAAESLGQIGTGNQNAIDALVQLIGNPQLDDFTRRQAAESLGQIDPGNQNAIDALMQLIVDDMENLRVLLVESDRNWQSILEEKIVKALKNISCQQYIIKVVDTFREAYQILKGSDWHLLVTAIRLKDSSISGNYKLGIQLVELAHEKDIPTIVVSGTPIVNTANVRDLLRMHGAKDYFDKDNFVNKNFIMRVQEILQYQLRSSPNKKVYQKNALEQTYALQSYKVANIRKALAIETEPLHKFQYEQQLQEEERNLNKLGNELQALEQELQSNEDSVLQQETSIHIEGSYIINILDNIVLHNEPANVAFPQANKFERVVDILSLLSKSDLIEDEITEKYNFDARQTRYYTDAGRYLDLITKSPSSAKDKSIFSLTDKGQYIMNQKYNQRFIDLTKAILQHEIFYKVFKSAINLNVIPSTKIIIEIMQASSINMSDQTMKRRASTVKAWIEWIWTQVNWKI